MLKKLRIRLTAICIVTTSIILSFMAVGTLYIYESQINNQSQITFQNNINSIVYKLQSSKTIDRTWLAQLEYGNNLIIHIEDNASPLNFNGSWKSKTDRNVLIDKVQKIALNEYDFNIKIAPYSVINTTSVTFQTEGNHNDKYQAATVIVPSTNGWQSLTLLRDLEIETTHKIFIRIIFAVLVLVVLLFLLVFSWWFAGRAIEPIEKNNKQQVEFIAAASHELRSPLSVISSSLSAFEISQQQADKDKFLSAIKRECVRMSRLTDDLLFLASSDAKFRSIKTENVEIETLLTQLYEDFEPIAKAKEQKLYLNLSENPLRIIQGDSQRLYQAISILLDNAIYYTPNKGNIKISGSETKYNIVITVSDDGIGISDENKKKIFERFYRVDLSRSKKEHYGLGLSVAFEIIKLHNSKINVIDTPGGGSTFVIKL